MKNDSNTSDESWPGPVLDQLRSATARLRRLSTLVGIGALLAASLVVGGLILGAEGSYSEVILGRFLAGTGLVVSALSSAAMWRREEIRSSAEVIHSELTIEYQRMARSETLAEHDAEERDPGSTVPLDIRIALREFVAAGDLPFGVGGNGPVRYLTFFGALAALAVLQWPTFN